MSFEAQRKVARAIEGELNGVTAQIIADRARIAADRRQIQKLKRDIAVEKGVAHIIAFDADAEGGIVGVSKQ